VIGNFLPPRVRFGLPGRVPVVEARVSKIPAWLGISVVFTVALVALVFLLTGRKETVVLAEGDRTMRPTLGKKVKGQTRVSIDPAWLDRPTPFAVVAFLPPGSTKPRMARAVGLPRDRLTVRNHKLFVNGKTVPVAKRRIPRQDVGEFVCPRDCFYVLVDVERGTVTDSLRYGPLPAWRVLGKVVLD